jgi:hypothetical protein
MSLDPERSQQPEEELPSAVARFVRKSFVEVLFELRRPGGSCAALPMSSWALLVAVLACKTREWNGTPTLTPTELSGLSGRAARKHLRLLQEAELVYGPRHKWSDYRLGEALRFELGRLAISRVESESVMGDEAAPGAIPARRAESELSVAPRAVETVLSAAPGAVDPPRRAVSELSAAPRAAEASLLKTNKNKLNSSSYFLKHPPPPTPVQAAPVGETPSDTEVAQEALATLYRLRHPSSPEPAPFRPDEVALVVARTRSCAGDADAKRALHRDAMRGAFLVSRGGPPTVRFVWGRMEHFLAHAARGRAEADREAAHRPLASLAKRTETPLPLQAASEAWARLGELTGSSRSVKPSGPLPLSAILADVAAPREGDREESTPPEK